MAWSAAPLGFVETTTAASSYVTTSYTPTANRLLVATVQNTTPFDPTGADFPALSGNGATWEQAHQESSTGADEVNTIFVAKSGASPSTEALTATYGRNQTGCSISVFEVDGADISGTALDAIVQSKSALAGAGATSASVTLDVAPAATNRSISMFTHRAGEASTPRANWDEMHDLQYFSPNRAHISQIRLDAAEQTGSASWASTVFWIGTVAEIAEATAGGDQTVSPGLITNTPVLYGPRIDQQVQLGLIANGYTIFAPTIAEDAAGPQTISPGLIENLPIVFAPQIDQSVAPGLISNPPTLFAPTISQTVDIGFINNAPTVYEPRIDQQALVGLIESLVNVYPPTINQQVQVGLIANPSTVYAPTITDDGPQTVSVGLISHGHQVYAPSITQFWVRETGGRPRRRGTRMPRKQRSRYDRGRDTGR